VAHRLSRKLIRIMQKEVLEFNTVLHCYTISTHALLLMLRGSKHNIHAVRLEHLGSLNP
jgi:hypothetical protein